LDYSKTTNMEQHKITYKTKDGTIKEQRFDEFNEFADAIEDAAMDYFGAASAAPEIDISSAFGAYGINYRESFKNGARVDSTVEFLGEETEGL
jgi:hypothetical protein